MYDLVNNLLGLKKEDYDVNGAGKNTGYRSVALRCWEKDEERREQEDLLLASKLTNLNLLNPQENSKNNAGS